MRSIYWTIRKTPTSQGCTGGSGFKFTRTPQRSLPARQACAAARPLLRFPTTRSPPYSRLQLACTSVRSWRHVTQAAQSRHRMQNIEAKTSRCRSLQRSRSSTCQSGAQLQAPAFLSSHLEVWAQVQRLTSVSTVQGCLNGHEPRQNELCYWHLKTFSCMQSIHWWPVLTDAWHRCNVNLKERCIYMTGTTSSTCSTATTTIKFDGRLHMKQAHRSLVACAHSHHT
jgi:hypothetical protein